MAEKIVYQCDRSGFYTGQTVADESPLEPGVFIIPARAIETAPPEQWPDDKWPRWNGAAWVLATKPKAKEAGIDDPVAKLQAFLHDNPDVAALLQSNDGGANV